MGSDRTSSKRPPASRERSDSADLDEGWDEPSPSRRPVSPVRGNTLRFGEESATTPESAPRAASPVRGGTLRWGELVAAVKRDLPAKRAPESGVRGGTRSWEELAAAARALGVEGVPESPPEDELEALAVDQLLDALGAAAVFERAAPLPAPPASRTSSRPEIVVEGELDLDAALADVGRSEDESGANARRDRGKGRR